MTNLAGDKMTHHDPNILVQKFQKIMGPVALTLAKDAAKACGLDVKGGRFESKGGKEMACFEKRMAEVCGKIIGHKVADTIIKNL